MWRAALGAAGLAALAAPAARGQAAVAAAPADPDATVVEELVVQGRLPGPAWWRVSDADTTVYVLGVPSTFPKGLDWNRAVLESRLEGASRLILPFNEVRLGLRDIPGALLGLGGVRSAAPMEDALPPALRARFVAARTGLGQPRKRYARWKPFVAALLLVSDFRDFAHLTAADPVKTIRRLGQARKLKIEQKAYSAAPLIRAAGRISPAAAQICMADALTEVEAGPGRVRVAGQGWANGDTRTALSLERGYERCLAGVAGATAFDAQFKADQTAAVARALRTPGHAVAVIQLRPLLSQGGVLDRLRGQGYRVLDPGQPDPTAGGA